MQDPNPQADPPSPALSRRKRLLFRAEHRGMREMDLLFGGYVKTAIDTLDEENLNQLEALIEVDDQEFFAWLMQQKPVPERYDTPLFRAIQAFRPHF